MSQEGSAIRGSEYTTVARGTLVLQSDESPLASFALAGFTDPISQHRRPHCDRDDSRETTDRPSPTKRFWPRPGGWAETANKSTTRIEPIGTARHFGNLWVGKRPPTSYHSCVRLKIYNGRWLRDAHTGEAFRVPRTTNHGAGATAQRSVPTVPDFGPSGELHFATADDREASRHRGQGTPRHTGQFALFPIARHLLLQSPRGGFAKSSTTKERARKRRSTRGALDRPLFPVGETLGLGNKRDFQLSA
jgi:hypothetical protein